PACGWVLAYSTIKMAFLHARPTSTTKPTCTKMLMSIDAITTPATEHSRHIGTTRITARGSDQLSYCAASTRKTSTTARKNTHMAVLPACNWSSASSVHSCRIEEMWLISFSVTSCSALIAWPELALGLAVALTAA